MELNIETIGWCALALFSLTWAIRMVYVFCFYFTPLFSVRKKDVFTPAPSDSPPVSIIVIALNKGIGFIRNIEKILAQQYPRFEVVVVIDNADKDVENSLKQLMHFDHRLRCTFIPHDTKNISRRKLAFVVAARTVRYDWVLQTECSCRPASETWLARMMNARKERTEIVVGGTVYDTVSVGIHRVMAYSDLLRSLEMLSCGIRRIPHLGSSANLLISKQLIISRLNFKESLKEEMGEDITLTNAAITKTNVAVELHPESLTISTFPDKKEWREKELSTARCRSRIKGPCKALWGANTFFTTLYGATFIATLFLQQHSILFLSFVVAMHLVYRCSFWAILYTYSHKTCSLRFYLLPFCSKLFYPFV